MSHNKSWHYLLWLVPVTAFVVMFLIIPIAVAVLLPGIQQVREARRREQARENLRQIGMALVNYHQQQHVSDEFEPSAPADALQCANQPP